MGILIDDVIPSQHLEHLCKWLEMIANEFKQIPQSWKVQNVYVWMD